MRKAAVTLFLGCVLALSLAGCGSTPTEGPVPWLQADHVPVGHVALTDCDPSQASQTTNVVDAALR